METFTGFRPLVVDPHYPDRRKRCLSELNIDDLDAPIAGLIGDLCECPFCFTIQSCFGHFLYADQEDPGNIDPLPSARAISTVEYRIAYIAFCVENSRSGRKFLRWLEQVPEIDPRYIQFCCAEWFWERNPNSYVLQVEPEKYRLKDTCTVDFLEACHIEKVRNTFYDHLRVLLSTIKLQGTGKKGSGR
jgi:hypothetical protein